MKKIIGLVALAAAAYLLYKNSKKETPVAPSIEPTPTRTKAQETKVALKKEGAKLIEPYYDSEAGKAAEKRFKSRTSANTELLMTGQKQYVTLENLIPNRYGEYNNFYGKDYNKRNVEDTTDIISAERTQSLFIRPKPLFNNALI
jgi:hypothetical protein